MNSFPRLVANWIARINSLNRWQSNQPNPNKKDKKRQLIYRGVSYEYDPLTVQVTEGEVGGMYRGSPWRFKTIQKPEVVQPEKPKPVSTNPIKSPFPQKNPKKIPDKIPDSPRLLKPKETRLVLNRDISLDQLIASSGEAEIWTIISKIQMVNYQRYLAKIYHQETPEQIEHSPERRKKLEMMVVYQPTVSHRHTNHISLAWPQYLLEDSSGEVIGFLMPLLEGNKLTKVYHPKLRQRLNLEWEWQVDWRFLHQSARDLAMVIQSLHTEGYIVGDLKPENILVNQQALPSIIDTDSFQIRHPHTHKVYRSLVGSEGLSPPELLGKNFAQFDQNPDHDNFRLAVIIYHLLIGEHPFKGHWLGDGEPPEIDELVRQGFWPYANHSLIQPGKLTIPLDIVHPQVKECFLRCFNDGHDFPNLRPKAKDWANSLQAALGDLVQCELYSSHWYSKTYGRCYWCERKESLGLDIFSHNTDRYKRLNRLLQERRWKEADLETKYLMLQITNRITQGWLDQSAIANFSIQELNMIDQLWREHSSESFGFSVQKRIYLETGNQTGEYNKETYSRFGEIVGWRGDRMWKNYFDLEFSLKAPPGHLPFCCAGFDICLVSHLALRLTELQIRQ